MVKAVAVRTTEEGKVDRIQLSRKRMCVLQSMQNRILSGRSAFGWKRLSKLLPELWSGYERGDKMRTLNGFATLCAIGLLGGDVIVGASISKIIFHFALLIVNLVFYMEGER